MLTDIFSPSECAECKLCCNFHRSSAWETPALESELIYLLQEECVPLEKRPDGSTSFYLHFCSNDENEVSDCPMLNRESGCTLPRELRPFECRIWPIRIMRDSSRLVIGVYKNCPALRGDALEKLINYAKGDLLPHLKSYAASHPLSIRPLNPAYNVIWQE